MYICNVKNDNANIWRGQNVPSFYKDTKMFENVERLLSEVLNDYPSLFLIELIITKEGKIDIIVDGDEGVSLKDCVTISRHVEKHLDREEHDFSIEVSSPGATTPIKNKRQYRKNLGKPLSIMLTNGEKIEGVLKEVHEETLVLTWKTREPKPVGKGKRTVIKTIEKAYSDIEEAKVIIKFN